MSIVRQVFCLAIFFYSTLAGVHAIGGDSDAARSDAAAKPPAFDAEPCKKIPPSNLTISEAVKFFDDLEKCYVAAKDAYQAKLGTITQLNTVLEKQRLAKVAELRGSFWNSLDEHQILIQDAKYGNFHEAGRLPNKALLCDTRQTVMSACETEAVADAGYQRPKSTCDLKVAESLCTAAAPEPFDPPTVNTDPVRFGSALWVRYSCGESKLMLDACVLNKGAETKVKISCLSSFALQNGKGADASARETYAGGLESDSPCVFLGVTKWLKQNGYF